MVWVSDLMFPVWGTMWESAFKIEKKKMFILFKELPAFFLIKMYVIQHASLFTFRLSKLSLSIATLLSLMSRILFCFATLISIKHLFNLFVQYIP